MAVECGARTVVITEMEAYGVDINRNYGYQWGYDDDGSSPTPSDETYRGAAPFSEPEIQAQRDFINSRHFKVIANYHSYSGLFLYPWGYDRIFSPDNEIFKQMGDTVHAMTGYTAGPPWLTLYPSTAAVSTGNTGSRPPKRKSMLLALKLAITAMVSGRRSPESLRWCSCIFNRTCSTPVSPVTLSSFAHRFHRPSMPSAMWIRPIFSSTGIISIQYNPAQSFEVWQMQDARVASPTVWRAWHRLG